MTVCRDKASVAYRFLRRPIRRGFQSFRSLKADSGFHCRSALVSVVFVDEKMAVKKKKQIRAIVSTYYHLLVQFTYLGCK